MLQRVMPDLLGMKNILVINDEAHHCYREKPIDPDEEGLKGDERKEAEKNNEAARLWISGLEAVGRKLGLSRVIDLSATPFFLRGSGYAEGTLFPWTMSDFSLMDAIECGIVKLPRVPVAENIPGDEMPMFRNLWEQYPQRYAQERAGVRAGALIHSDYPPVCKRLFRRSTVTTKRPSSCGMTRASQLPPCFIIVCQNTAISKLVYDHSSQGSTGRTKMVPPHWKMDDSRCFAILTIPPATPFRVQNTLLDRQRATRSWRRTRR